MKVIFLGQAHCLPFGRPATQNYIDCSLRSQLAIKNFIVKHSDAPVVLEGLTENGEGDVGPMSDVSKMTFPNGIPDEIGQLNPFQKLFLYEQGAVRSLFYLGILKNMYRSIHPEISATIDASISNGNFEKIFKDREDEAMLCIDEVVAEKNPGSVILVYGAAHDFSSYCAERGYEYEQINTVVERVAQESPVPRTNTVDVHFLSPDMEAMEIIKGKTYPIYGSNLSFQFTKTKVEDLCMSLMRADKMEVDMLVDTQFAKIILSQLDTPNELISFLKTQGESTTDMAKVISSQLCIESTKAFRKITQTRQDEIVKGGDEPNPDAPTREFK